MLLWTTLKIALASLASNKLRSALTMLGVIIGVGAVIAMLSLGQGFTAEITGQISSLGTNLLFIQPGQSGMGPRGMTQSLTIDDAEALLAVPGIRAVSPMAFASGQIKAGNRNTSSPMIAGVSPAYLPMRNYTVVQGRLFSDSETRRQARVAVLGPKVATDLFGDVNPVDRDIKIRGLGFHVVGVVDSKGNVGGQNVDDIVYIPFTTAMKQFPPRRDYVQFIMAETYTREDIDPARQGAADLLRQRHRIQEGEDNDFSVQTMAEFLATFQRIMLVLTLFLAVVAGISLIVGGIGIMNIMLATVAERTREIGIRKALGAKDRDIMRQFLIEALVITLGGGLIGMLLGWGVMAAVAAGVRQWIHLAARLQWWVVLISVGVATTVGLLSGLYPAWRASRLDPVEALRYE